MRKLKAKKIKLKKCKIAAVSTRNIWGGFVNPTAPTDDPDCFPSARICLKETQTNITE